MFPRLACPPSAARERPLALGVAGEPHDEGGTTHVIKLLVHEIVFFFGVGSGDVVGCIERIALAQQPWRASGLVRERSITRIVKQIVLGGT
jgi:hypothetical protein